MNPDLEKRVPREILAELIEEGTEAFRGILEKLFNVAMQLERSEFLGAEAYERTASRRGYRNGFKGKRIQTRVGELHLEIPQVRGLRFYPKSLERGCRSEKALKLAIAEMYVMGVSTRKVTEITEQLCGLEISATQVSRVAGMLDEELEEFRSRELGEALLLLIDVGVNVSRGRNVGVTELLLSQLQASGFPVDDGSDQMSESVTPRGPFANRHLRLLEGRVDTVTPQGVRIQRTPVDSTKDEILRFLELR